MHDETVLKHAYYVTTTVYNIILTPESTDSVSGWAVTPTFGGLRISVYLFYYCY